MVSRYPKDAAPMNKDKAIEAGKALLIKAYENKYGKFTPLPNLPAGASEADSLRYYITCLSVVTENDRFYIMNFAREFWVDKYTGTAYYFYPGQIMKTWRFNPTDPGALTFAG